MKITKHTCTINNCIDLSIPNKKKIVLVGSGLILSLVALAVFSKYNDIDSWPYPGSYYFNDPECRGCNSWHTNLCAPRIGCVNGKFYQSIYEESFKNIKS